MEVDEMTNMPSSGISDPVPKPVDSFLRCIAEGLARQWIEEQQQLRDDRPCDRRDLPALKPQRR